MKIVTVGTVLVDMYDWMLGTVRFEKHVAEKYGIKLTSFVKLGGLGTGQQQELVRHTLNIALMARDYKPLGYLNKHLVVVDECNSNGNLVAMCSYDDKYVYICEFEYL